MCWHASPSARELRKVGAVRQENIAAGLWHVLGPSKVGLRTSFSSISSHVHTCVWKCMCTFTTVRESWHLFSALCSGETCAASLTFFFLLHHEYHHNMYPIHCVTHQDRGKGELLAKQSIGFGLHLVWITSCFGTCVQFLKQAQLVLGTLTRFLSNDTLQPPQHLQMVLRLLGTECVASGLSVLKLHTCNIVNFMPLQVLITFWHHRVCHSNVHQASQFYCSQSTSLHSFGTWQSLLAAKLRLFK